MGSATPQLSVVLANYNGRRYLQACLESVLAQDFTSFEFIIVDDGSTDGSADLIRAFARQHADRVRAIFQPENAGQGAGFNAGIAAARGQIISFLDSDDVWYPDKLSTVAREFGDPDRTAFHQHQLAIMRDETVTDEMVAETLQAGDVFGATRRSGKLPNFVPTSGLSFSRRALAQIGPIPRAFRICADGFLTRSSMCFGRVSVSDRVCGAYRVHGANNTYQNNAFDADGYIRRLLMPQLDLFYARRHIPFRFALPAEEPAPASAAPEPVLGKAWCDVLRLRAGDRVVVIRSAPPPRVHPCLALLRARGVEVHLVVQENMVQEFSGHEVTAHVIPSGPVGPETFPVEKREELRALQPACVLVLYNGISARPYGNVHQMISVVGFSCPLVGLSAHGALNPIDPVSVLAPEPELTAPAAPPITALPRTHFEANHERLLALRDRFRGRRAFLIGNGPSLKMSDLDRLHAAGEITLASNKIFLAYEQTAWRPTVYCMCDEVVARNNRERILALPHMKVFGNNLRRYLWDDPEACFVNPRMSLDTQEDVVGWDLARGANAGHSVLNLSIKVAYWMGIRDMYIIGADHNFVVPETKTGERIMNNEVIVAGGEVNHFHPDYRPKGEAWTVPKLDKIEEDFAESKRILEAAGGTVRNASRFSKLQVFERVDFDALFQLQEVSPCKL